MTKNEFEMQFEKRVRRLVEERLYALPRRRVSVRTIKVIPWHKKISLKRWLLQPLAVLH